MPENEGKQYSIAIKYDYLMLLVLLIFHYSLFIIINTTKSIYIALSIKVSPLKIKLTLSNKN